MTEGNFMACSCTVAKVNQQQSSSAPAQFNSHWWYFVPLFLRCHTKAPSYSWLKLTGVSWMAWVALHWWQSRKVQTLPTNLDTIAVPNTHLHTCPIAQWEASCSTWNMPAVPLPVQQKSQTDQYPTAFTVYPDLKFMFSYMTA